MSRTEATKPTGCHLNASGRFENPDHLESRPVSNLPHSRTLLCTEPHGPSFTGKLGNFILFCWKVFTKTNEMFLRDEETANF